MAPGHEQRLKFYQALSRTESSEFVWQFLPWPCEGLAARANLGRKRHIPHLHGSLRCALLTMTNIPFAAQVYVHLVRGFVRLPWKFAQVV